MVRAAETARSTAKAAGAPGMVHRSVKRQQTDDSSATEGGRVEPEVSGQAEAGSPWDEFDEQTWVLLQCVSRAQVKAQAGDVSAWYAALREEHGPDGFLDAVLPLEVGGARELECRVRTFLADMVKSFSLAYATVVVEPKSSRDVISETRRVNYWGGKTPFATLGSDMFSCFLEVNKMCSPFQKVQAGKPGKNSHAMMRGIDDYGHLVKVQPVQRKFLLLPERTKEALECPMELGDIYLVRTLLYLNYIISLSWTLGTVRSEKAVGDVRVRCDELRSLVKDELAQRYTRSDENADDGAVMI